MQEKSKTLLIEKPVIEYSFLMRKSNAGLVLVGKIPFTTPKGDGKEIKALLRRIPNGTNLHMTCTVEE